MPGRPADEPEELCATPKHPHAGGDDTVPSAGVGTLAPALQFAQTR